MLHVGVHVAAAIVLVAALSAGMRPLPEDIVLWLAAILAAKFPMPLPGREHDATSLVPVTLVGSALVLPWQTAVPLIGTAVLLGRLIDKQPPRGAFYNASASLVQTALACAAVDVVRDLLPALDPLVVLPLAATAATIAAGLTNVALMAPVFALNGMPLATAARMIVSADVVPHFVLGATAVAVAVLHERHPALVLTLVGPLAVVHLYERSVDQALREAVRATTDALTGLGNRRAFEERCGRELERLAAGDVPALAVVMLDLDGFKGVNDGHGHERGDELLVEVARALGAEGFRHGGDEFALLLVGADELRAQRRGRDVAARIAAGPIARAHGVTASVGVASAEPGELALGELVARADMALYAAKRARRDAA